MDILLRFLTVSLVLILSSRSYSVSAANFNLPSSVSCEFHQGRLAADEFQKCGASATSDDQRCACATAFRNSLDSVGCANDIIFSALYTAQDEICRTRPACNIATASQCLVDTVLLIVGASSAVDACSYLTTYSNCLQQSTCGDKLGDSVRAIIQKGAAYVCTSRVCDIFHTEQCSFDSFSSVSSVKQSACRCLDDIGGCAKDNLYVSSQGFTDIVDTLNQVCYADYGTCKLDEALSCVTKAGECAQKTSDYCQCAETMSSCISQSGCIPQEHSDVVASISKLGLSCSTGAFFGPTLLLFIPLIFFVFYQV